MGFFSKLFRKEKEVDIISEYQRLSDAGKWEEALPVIEEIVSRGEHIATSWFNWGVCLSALGLESDAAQKFLRAYDLEPTDYGAQYRIFRSLYLANEFENLLSFTENEFKKMPEIFDLLEGDEDLHLIFERDDFQQLRNKLTADEN